MSDQSQTGPWALALGAFAIGVGAVAAAALRRRRDDSANDTPDDADTPSPDAPPRP